MARGKKHTKIVSGHKGGKKHRGGKKRHGKRGRKK